MSELSPDKHGLVEPADKMAEGIRRAVQSGALDSRSMAADAELIYTARRERTRSHARQSDWSKPENTAAAPHVPNGQINVLAPGERSSGEIAGYRNDDAPLARDVQTRPTSQERVSNPVEDTTFAPSTTPQKLSEPHEPPMVYDPMQGMVRPGGIRALMNDLRKLYDKTAEAHDGDYPEKVDHGLVAVYAYGRRQTTPSATPCNPDTARLDFLQTTVHYDEKDPEIATFDDNFWVQERLPKAKGDLRKAIDESMRAADGGKQTKSNDS